MAGNILNGKRVLIAADRGGRATTMTLTGSLKSAETVTPNKYLLIYVFIVSIRTCTYIGNLWYLLGTCKNFVKKKNLGLHL